MTSPAAGAISPYAPTGRNAFLQRLLPEQVSDLSSQRRLHKAAGVALALLVIKYYQSPQFRSLREFCKLQRILARAAVGGLVPATIGQWVARESSRLWTHVATVWTTLMESIPVATWSRARPLLLPLQSERFIRTNQHSIQTVLHYWFGQYTPDGSQKKLWMIANSSVEQRTRVDADIVDKFEAVVLQLAGGLWEDWCDDIHGYQGKLAAIICLDQFSRHQHRFYEHAGTSRLPSQSTLDTLAYQISQLLFETHKTELTTGMVPLPMQIFGLMPYRHASTMTSVAFVQHHIANMDEMHVQMDAMTRRFRKATNRRMAVLQDESRRTGTDKTDFADDDILETVAFQADMEPAVHHVVYSTISSFLKHQRIMPNSSATIPVVVSLSGGVDSMVIASVLAHMARTNYNFKVYAIHIDYGNRPESAAEAAFVERYCDQLNIVYTCRRIDEVTRGVASRDDYERIARELRYHSYRTVVQECRAVNDQIQIGVILGHHRGDLRENVLSNAHKGCGPLDLSGMTGVSQNDGVVIYRPLLPLEKDKVFDFSHTYGVPYFKDTTPHWSTRGKLRNKLIPLLEEIYGEGSMNNLSSLATESDEARGLLQMAVLGPFLERVKHHPLGISFETAEWKTQGMFFWKFVLREALHKSGLGMFSDKSVMAFLERVQLEKLRAGWLQCRKDYAVFLRDDGKVFVLFPRSFPFRKADQYNCVDQKIAYGEEKIVGPWSIQATIVQTNGRSVTSLLEQKAVETMETFMTGNIEYYVKVLKSKPSSLLFSAEFSKASRPPAWKSTDAKIQKTLPLLANPETAFVDTLDDFDVARVVMKVIN